MPVSLHSEKQTAPSLPAVECNAASYDDAAVLHSVESATKWLRTSAVPEAEQMRHPSASAVRRSFSEGFLNELGSRPPDSPLLRAGLADLVLQVSAQSAPYVAPALAGMRDETFAQGMVVVRRMPNRVRLLRQSVAGLGNCPFCRKRATFFLQEYNYQSWIFSQNLGPYGPNSFLLRPPAQPGGGHYTQADTVQFLSRLGGAVLSDLPGGMTFFSNHLAGNSQAHLHFQLLGCLPPVAKLLSDEDKSSVLAWDETGFLGAEYAMLDGKNTANGSLPLSHFLGCFLRGTPEGVAKAAGHYLTVARQYGNERFNFTSWRDAASKQIAMFIVLRNANNLAWRLDRLPNIVGAMATAGFVVDEFATRERCQPFDYDRHVNYMAENTLPVCRSAFPIA